MKEAIVLYPSPAISHLISMVELGKLILTQKPSLTIHILISTLPYSSGSIEPYIAGVASTTSSITFHRLPTVSLPPDTVSSSPNNEILILESLRLNNPNIHQLLLSISKTFTISALVLDLFCVDGVSIATRLNIPAYYFFPSAVGFLAYFLCFPDMDQIIKKNVNDVHDLVLDVPGIPPIPFFDLPKAFQDPKDKAYELFLYGSTQLQKSAGIIVNSFETLESRTLKTISGELGVMNKPTPPIYAIGPLVASDQRSDGGDSHACMTWLDSQPVKSVVFLCFGSLGVFSIQQLREIAIGLEKSGQRFMWVLRNPPASEGQTIDISGSADPDLETLLPDGFLERTKGRGLVVKKWAPQVAVLSHDSVGGFVTHSGWNSALEAVCAGVPMVSWPLYAEQRLNKILLVEEMRIAFPMKESENGLVSAEEVEKRVKQLMVSEEGELTRERVGALKLEAEAALRNGGSSRVALTQLIESL